LLCVQHHDILSQPEAVRIGRCLKSKVRDLSHQMAHWVDCPKFCALSPQNASSHLTLILLPGHPSHLSFQVFAICHADRTVPKACHSKCSSCPLLGRPSITTREPELRPGLHLARTCVCFSSDFMISCNGMGFHRLVEAERLG
jgi:hypothetical protein